MPQDVFSRIFLILALCGTAGALAADSAFLLGPDFSEWLDSGGPNGAFTTEIATDNSGALYLFTISFVTSATNPPVCRVTKLSADGNSVLWRFDAPFQANAMAVDPAGGVYLLSPNTSPVFVAKLAMDGSGIAWQAPVSYLDSSYSTFFAVDSQGRVFIAGSHNGSGAVVRLRSDGTATDFAVSALAGVPRIAVDGTGGVFLAVDTTGSDSKGPTTFLARVGPDGSEVFHVILPAATLGLAAGPGGEAVLYSIPANGKTGVLERVDPSGGMTLLKTGLFPESGGFAVDSAGNIYLTGSMASLRPVKNTLATCGLNLLSIFGPDGAVLQTTYIPGGVGGSPLVAAASNSSVSVVDRGGDAFVPTRPGPFARSAPAGAQFLWRLVPDPNAHTLPLACVDNGASYAAYFAVAPTALGVAPGTIVSLFGNGLGPQEGIATQAAPDHPFPTEAGSVHVTFDGKPAPLLWVQDAQINAIAPWSLAPGQDTQVCVSYGSVKTNCLTLPVVQTSPGVFTTDGVHAAALNQDGTINSADHPAPVGSIVSIFATGLGAIVPDQGDGTVVGAPLPVNAAQVSVQWFAPPGSAGTFNVTYAGPAPGLVAGGSQINFQVENYKGKIFLQAIVGQSNGFEIYIAGQ